jgi:hypothetical protein
MDHWITSHPAFMFTAGLALGQAMERFKPEVTGWLSRHWPW